MSGSNEMQSQFEQRLTDVAATVEEAMDGYLSRDVGVPGVLREAMAYSLHAGGKRLRPVMVILACEACGGQEVRALPAAAALEMVHTYSLIHDDLPAMDDDDLRRGQPTSHKVFGEGTAILAGDALLTYAFGTLAGHVQQDGLARQLTVELAEAAGAAGMIGGQIADLNVEHKPPTLERVNYIHTRKTAMMFRAAARMGALCAEAAGGVLDVLGDYGLKVGLAFQIIDDLLDVTSTAEALGKATQKDADAGKLTYPGVVGLEQSRAHAAGLIAQAVGSLADLGAAAEPLRLLAGMMNDRTH